MFGTVEQESRSAASRDPWIRLGLAVVVQSMRDLHSDQYYAARKKANIFELSYDAYRFLVSDDCLYFLRVGGFSVTRGDILRAMAAGKIQQLKRR